MLGDGRGRIGVTDEKCQEDGGQRALGRNGVLGVECWDEAFGGTHVWGGVK